MISGGTTQDKREAIASLFCFPPTSLCFFETFATKKLNVRYFRNNTPKNTSG